MKTLQIAILTLLISTPITFAQERSKIVIQTGDASQPASAQGLDQTVRRRIDMFFNTVKLGKVEAAIDDLVKGSRIAEKQSDIATLKTKTQQALALFGGLTGHELISVGNVGTRLLRATYLSLGRDFPLRWRFYFYRADDAWRLIDIRVDDKLVEMFGESSEPKPATEWPRQQE